MPIRSSAGFTNPRLCQMRYTPISFPAIEPKFAIVITIMIPKSLFSLFKTIPIIGSKWGAAGYSLK